MNKEFAAAPWGARVKVITLLLIVLLLLLPGPVLFAVPGVPLPIAGLVVGIMAAVIGGTSLFVVRGFRLSRDTLFVQRSFWENSISLAGLQSAEVDPRACERAWKTVGNDGLFAMHGWFRNQRLGKFQAFVTDPTRCVVLRFADRIVVVSPEQPRRLAEELNHRLRRAEAKR